MSAVKASGSGTGCDDRLLAGCELGTSSRILNIGVRFDAFEGAETYAGHSECGTSGTRVRQATSITIVLPRRNSSFRGKAAVPNSS